MAGKADKTLRSIRYHLLAIVGAVAVLGGGIGVLSAHTELAGAVIAPGSLVVESNVKKVQHPTGGTVGTLLVKDGAQVREGDILIHLDETVAKANLAAIVSNLMELSGRRARLEAERDGADDIIFPADVLARADDEAVSRVITGERKLFRLRTEALRGEKAQLRERIGQLTEEIAGLTQQRDAKSEEIRLIEKELGGVRELWEKKLVPLTRMSALERDGARLRGEHGSLLARTAETRGKISELELKILQIDQNMRSDVAKELAEIRAKSAELNERRIAAQDVLDKLDIRSPQDGIVQDLAVHARGGVVTSGEPVMLIVPRADSLVVEVRIRPQDIDRVHLNQPAMLRFTNFNQRTTPELEGKIIRLSPDVTKDENSGASYYLARAEITDNPLKNELTFIPGMPVEVFIRTNERTLVSYLLKPLTDHASRAFREK